MSLILFIDTAAAHTQVALANEHSILSEKVHLQSNEQAKVLNLMIEEQLQQGQLSWKDIDAIAVDAGPGSYTGLRVGLGVAKGLCFALEKPILLFNRLQLLADRDADVLLILKARAGEGFAYAKTKNDVLLGPGHIFYDQFDWSAYEALNLVTDDETLLSRSGNAKAIADNVLDINAWNRSAQERYKKQDLDDLAYCEPHYLKNAFTTTSRKKI